MSICRSWLLFKATVHMYAEGSLPSFKCCKEFLAIIFTDRTTLFFVSLNFKMFEHVLSWSHRTNSAIRHHWTLTALSVFKSPVFTISLCVAVHPRYLFLPILYSFLYLSADGSILNKVGMPRQKRDNTWTAGRTIRTLWNWDYID